MLLIGVRSCFFLKNQGCNKTLKNEEGDNLHDFMCKVRHPQKWHHRS